MKNYLFGNTATSPKDNELKGYTINLFEDALTSKLKVFSNVTPNVVTKAFIWYLSSESRNWGCPRLIRFIKSQWRHNGHDGVSNHQTHDCLLNRLFRRRSIKTSKLRVIGLSAGNSPVTGEFPAQKASNAEDVSIWWRHHDSTKTCTGCKFKLMVEYGFTSSV